MLLKQRICEKILQEYFHLYLLVSKYSNYFFVFEFYENLVLLTVLLSHDVSKTIHMCYSPKRGPV